MAYSLPREASAEQADGPAVPEAPANEAAEAEFAASVSIVEEASSPITEDAAAVRQPAARKPARDPTFAIVVIAVIIGVAGIATLFALFLW